MQQRVRHSGQAHLSVTHSKRPWRELLLLLLPVRAERACSPAPFEGLTVPSFSCNYQRAGAAAAGPTGGADATESLISRILLGALPTCSVRDYVCKKKTKKTARA